MPFATRLCKIHLLCWYLNDIVNHVQLAASAPPDQMNKEKKTCQVNQTAMEHWASGSEHIHFIHRNVLWHHTCTGVLMSNIVDWDDCCFSPKASKSTSVELRRTIDIHLTGDWAILSPLYTNISNMFRNHFFVDVIMIHSTFIDSNKCSHSAWEPIQFPKANFHKRVCHLHLVDESS